MPVGNAWNFAAIDTLRVRAGEQLR
jgi:hypothetical protein